MRSNRHHLLICAGLCLLIAGQVFGIGPLPDQTLLWNSFRDVTVVDSFALGMSPEGIVVSRFDVDDSIFVQVNQLYVDEPVHMKRQGDWLLVGTMWDSLIVVDLARLPQIEVLGGVQVDLPISDFARHGDDLYVSAWFAGILRYTVDGDNRVDFVDSSMKPVLVTQVEVVDDRLYGLDEYNGIFRYDLSAGGFGSFIDYLFVPVRGYSFLPNGNDFVIATLNDGVFFGEFGHTGSGITEALGSGVAARRILVTDDRFVMVADRFVEVIDRVDHGSRFTISIGDDPPYGDVFYLDGNPHLLLPGQFGGLELYELEPSGGSRSSYYRPGPITGLLLRDGLLYTGGEANPVDVYRLDRWRTKPRLDFTIYSGLDDVVSIGHNGDSLIVLYNGLSRIAFISSCYDADDYYLESSVFVDPYNAFRVEYLEDWLEGKPAVVMYGSSSISVYPINDSNVVEHGVTWPIIGEVLTATFSDSLLIVSTGKNEIFVYQVEDDGSRELLSSLALATPAHELVMLEGRLVYFTHDGMTYVDLTDPNRPTIETTLPLAVPVTDGVRYGDRLYTVGERGVAVYDLTSSPPALIDRGGLAGTMLATDGSVVATTNGTSVHLYYLSEEKLLRVESTAVLPERFALSQNYPNPFNPVTFIDFSLPRTSRVKVEVFNVLGQVVTTLVDGQRAAGHHTVSWDGRDDWGIPVASGVYLYRISTHDFHASNKMMLVR